MGRVPEEVVDQIRDGAPIEDVVGEFVRLKKAGTNYKGLCPFHDEKTPSFNVNPRMGIYKCFGCGAGGNVFQFLMQHEGMTFPEALSRLAKRQGIDLSRYEGSGERSPQKPDARQKMLAANRLAADFFRAALESNPGERGRKYLEERGVTDDALDRFRVGFAPPRWDALIKAAGKRGVSPGDLAEAGLAVRREDGSGFYDRFRDRIMFPIRNHEGEIVGFGGRSLPDSDSRHATAKYVNSPDTALFRKGRTLYGFYEGREAIREKKRVLVTEGYFDVISLWRHGFREAVAPLGTALTAEHIRSLRAHAEELVFVFDPDAAGLAASERAGSVAGRMLGLAGAPDLLVASDVLRKNFIDRDGAGAVRLKVVNLPEGRDVDTFLGENGADDFDQLLADAEGILENTVRTAMAGIAAGASQAEKIEAIQRLLPILGACHRSVQDQYLALVEDQLGIPYPTLTAMVRRLLAENARESSPRGEEKKVDLLGENLERPKFETDALQLLLMKPELASEVPDELMTDEAVNEVLSLMKSQDAASLTAASIADRLESAAARALVVELAVVEVEPEEVEAELFDCIERLKERRRRKTEEDLMKRIEQTRKEEGEDSAEMWKLLERKNALLRERQRAASPR
ncbi:MAG: DNA primase [Nitrospinae bacterium]|nr:DNA primase [Nitrospinota bacterium]